MLDRPTPVVAIIGGGCSGTLVAAQLLRQAGAPIKIKLVERYQHQLHRGIAYSSGSACHLLNVPAGNMSAFPDEPAHFLDWAKHHAGQLIEPPWVSEIDAGSFISRLGYGEYLGRVIGDSIKQSAVEPDIEIIQDEAVAVQLTERGAMVSLHSGAALDADKIVLAVGNFPPADPPVSEQITLDRSRYIVNPWVDAASLAWDGIDECLIVGAGLTMVDWVLNLHQQNFRGKIHVVSRRGLQPKAHAPYQELPCWVELDQAPLSVRALFRQFRQLLAEPLPYHYDNWRGLVDALRPKTGEIWQALPLTEQKRFLRHLRPYWENHRHRLAPVTHATLKAIADSGQLRYHTGRIETIDDDRGKIAVRIRTRGQAGYEHLRVDRVLNCTGAECDYRKLQHPLMTDLFSKGLATLDSISFGLAVAEDGALLDKSGTKSPVIHTLGPPKKGSLWETTAVPEIRGQAQRLAGVLLSEIC